MSYTELTFHDLPQEKREVIIALLSDQEFEGFEEFENDLKAYVPSKIFDRKMAENLARNFSAQMSINELQDKNYNEIWEANFQPVIVENFCAIRAPFHPSLSRTRYELIITPKMSFGTGHHATTFMMISRMQHIDFKDKTVLDFGTGTGVLAILSFFLGAKRIIAVDYDEWSIANAKENFEVNHTSAIQLLQKDNASDLGSFDIILANVTRNVISDNFSHFVSQLKSGGYLLLSGLLEEDTQHIQMLCQSSQLNFNGKSTKNNWICMEFAKP